MNQAPLGAAPDPSFDRLARLIREAVGVPVALVSVVESERQVFPGASGLPAPWSECRETPLSHSFCQHVVARSDALVIEDARTEPLVRGNRAVAELGVVAYAGFPLVDPAGRTLGSVCAIDHRPRRWTEAELTIIADVAAVASAELELRESRTELARVAQGATQMSQRSSLLLEMSEAFGVTTTAGDVAAAVNVLGARHLNCERTGVWAHETENGRPVLRLVDGPGQKTPEPPEWSEWPEGPAATGRGAAGDGRVVAPLVAGGRPVGVMVLQWAEAHRLSNDDAVTVAALRSYGGQALHRAQLLAERSSVARTLQKAMLSGVLPQPEGVQLAARYLPLAEHDEVGGDWYDAAVMPDGSVDVTIGDVQGHDVGAASVMGALRNMLRTLSFAVEDSPAETLRRLDRSARHLDLPRLASVVLGQLTAEPDGSSGSDGLNFEWSSAGHLPPLLVLPDGRCRTLDDELPHDYLIGISPDSPRRNRQVFLPRGSTLLLYTDGLVENPERDLDAGIGALCTALVRHRGLDLERLLDAVILDVVQAATEDDVAALAVRVE